MLEASTLYLILAMAAFVFVAVIMIHQHNSSDAIRRKENEFESVSQQLTPRIENFEVEIVDLKLDLDEIEDEIEAYKMQGKA